MDSRPVIAPSPDIVAEASAWFVEFREGHVPSQTRARFVEWLRRSPEHIQAYLEVSAAWSELPTRDPEGRFDVAALVARAHASRDENVVPLGAPARGEDTPAAGDNGFWRARAGLSAAAALASLAVALGAWQWWHAGAYATGVGEQRTVRLSDGSTVELNALSRIQVRLSRDRRDIELNEGQALFHVAKDPTRPFIVRTGDTDVRAVGTEFDVYRKLSGTTVTVLEGEVAVLPTDGQHLGTANRNVPDTVPPAGDASPGRATPPEPLGTPAAAAILLSAGEQITVTAHQVSKPKKTDTAAATAWTEQRLIFEATPLGDVAAEFNRYNAKKLVIGDAALGSLGISGVYSSADPAALIGFLRAQPTLAITETQDEIRVTRREPH
jgi:transmembrane sensor